jgi:hypothetical protein
VFIAVGILNTKKKKKKGVGTDDEDKRKLIVRFKQLWTLTISHHKLAL